MIEILAPSGNLTNLITAVSAGADAVYLGLKSFSARASATNFSKEDLKYGISYAKLFNVKVYITVNTMVKDEELSSFFENIATALSLGADAFILQDIFLAKTLKELFPSIVLHLSTQAGVCNEYGAKQAKELGFSRVILARETKIEDIAKICKIIETEVFIQGALCSCFSGHCYMSSFIGANSGNRGQCKQPCRKIYSSKIGKGYLMSLSDLSIGDDISELINLGVTSFKIEGRMRSDEYIYNAIKYYRAVVDGLDNKNIYLDNLKIAFNRGNYTKGLSKNQDKTFLSTNIQSNLGLNIGVVSKVFNNYLEIKTNKKLIKDDCFKFVRNDRETGNGIYQDKILFKGDVKPGDLCYLTKTTINQIEKKLKDLHINIIVEEGKNIIVNINSQSYVSEFIVDGALTNPTTKDDIVACFNKVDIYPFKPIIKVEIVGNPFIVKSKLNNYRASIYSKLFFNDELKIEYSFVLPKIDVKVKNKEITVITDKYIENSNIDIIYTPIDYVNIDNKDYSNMYLYIPPFMSGKDLEIIKPYLIKFKGIYGEGYWSIEYAKENNVELYSGIGFNIYNSIDVIELNKQGVNKITISKELSKKDINILENYGSMLCGGSLELMDFIYCPFGRDCAHCKYENNYTIVDELGYKFIYFRYKLSECRFKLFNGKYLANDNTKYSLFDLRLVKNYDYLINSKSKEEKELLFQGDFTHGNIKKGVN